MQLPLLKIERIICRANAVHDFLLVNLARSAICKHTAGYLQEGQALAFLFLLLATVAILYCRALRVGVDLLPVM